MSTVNRQGFDEALTTMLSANTHKNDYIFYAHMIAQCRILFDENLDAMAAVSFHHDHYNLHINLEGKKQYLDPKKLESEELPDEVEKEIQYDENNQPYIKGKGFNDLPIEQRLGALKHEMLHILYGHLLRVGKRDFQKFNFSSDCALNQHIKRDHLPRGCIYPDNLPVKPNITKVPEGKTAEQYYEMLDDSKMPPPPPQAGEGESQSNSHGTPGDHATWQQSQGDEIIQKDLTKKMAEKAANETQKSRGNVPVEYSDWLEIHSNKQVVDWKRELRNLIGNRRVGAKKTIMRRNRRQPHLKHIKGQIKDRIGVPVVVGDESGSVSSKELTEAIGEILHICNLYQAPLWYVPVDSQAHKPHMLKSKDRKFQRTACGGTILAPAIEKIEEHNLDAAAIVVITDGYIGDRDIYAFSKTNKQIVWLITSEGSEINPLMTKGKSKAFKLPKNKGK